ncbi:MAG: hypothetical protein V4819_11375 [Verrucomicrobiota bacterium]
MKQLIQFLRNTGIWAPITVLVFHQFVSINDWRTEIDWLNHYSGGLSFSYFAWKCLPYLSRWTGNPSSLGRLMISFLSGCTAALLWEIAEFSSDLFLHTTIQKAVNETMMDIVNGFLGTMTAILILGFLESRRLNRTRVCA